MPVWFLPLNEVYVPLIAPSESRGFHPHRCLPRQSTVTTFIFPRAVKLHCGPALSQKGGDKRGFGFRLSFKNVNEVNYLVSLLRQQQWHDTSTSGKPRVPLDGVDVGEICMLGAIRQTLDERGSVGSLYSSALFQNRQIAASLAVYTLNFFEQLSRS